MCKNIIISQLESNQKSTNFTKQVICGIDIVTNLSGMPLLWFKGFVGRRSAKRGYVGVWRVLPPQSNIRPVTHFAHNLVKKLLDPAEGALRDPSFASHPKQTPLPSSFPRRFTGTSFFFAPSWEQVDPEKKVQPDNDDLEDHIFYGIFMAGVVFTGFFGLVSSVE